MLDFPGLVPPHLGSQPPWRSPPCPEPCLRMSRACSGHATLPAFSMFLWAPRPGFAEQNGRGSGLRYFRTLASFFPTPRVRVDQAKSACSAAPQDDGASRNPGHFPDARVLQVLRASRADAGAAALPTIGPPGSAPLARRGAGVAFFNATPRGQPGLPSQSSLGPAGSQGIKTFFM